MRIIPVILAGGSGERLWPLSKSDYPKQFVAFDASDMSLFQHSLIRVADRALFAAPIIVCNHDHRFIVSEQLRTIGCDDATLIVEPVARNTAPALALAALHVEEETPARLLLVMPSDHQITHSTEFLAAVRTGAPAAAGGAFVTFAMTPHGPETGYGYIHIGEAMATHSGVHHIQKFVEKPNRATAESYLAQGGYGWNSGIFLMQSSMLLRELAEHAPAMFDACQAAHKTRSVERQWIRPDKSSMQHCPADSIDYALMERTKQGAVIPVAMGWSDLGSWTSLAEMGVKDPYGNVITGRVIHEETSGCYIRSNETLVATLGLQEMVVVAADHAILIGPKQRMQDIKLLLRQMREKFLPDVNLIAFAHRPWGSFYNIDRGTRYKVKKLHLKPGGKISLQSHKKRSEHWVVVEGRATITNGDHVAQLEENQSTYIPAGAVHRLENREATDLVVIEVQTGSYLGEDDIVRFEDVYQRHMEEPA